VKKENFILINYPINYERPKPRGVAVFPTTFFVFTSYASAILATKNNYIVLCLTIYRYLFTFCEIMNECLPPLLQFNEFSNEKCIDCLNQYEGICKAHYIEDNRDCFHTFGPFEFQISLTKKTMTPENYEKLRSKIILACPELKENEEPIYKTSEVWQTLHPIRIAHVLRALDKRTSKVFFRIYSSGTLEDYNDDKVLRIWNLEQDDLALQSEETKMFLFDLLCSE